MVCYDYLILKRIKNRFYNDLIDQIKLVMTINRQLKKHDYSKIKGGLLARNTLLNLIGQAVPLLVGVVTIPFIVRGMGTERFGLLSLVWVVLGYFTIFDLGLGRATTKFVAETLGSDDDDKIPKIVWTSVAIQVVMGLIGTSVLFSIIPILIERVLNIPTLLWGEARIAFYLLSLTIPLVFISGIFQGVLEAAQRFDIVNAVKIPSNALIFVLPLVGLFMGFKLPGIVTLLLLSRCVTFLVLVMLNLRLNPSLRRYAVSWGLFPRLFSFGGWVMISNIVGPVLVYLDRFLIGSLLTMTAVSYYSAPYEAVTRLWIISVSLTMTLFPTFSSLESSMERHKLGTLFARSIKYILTVLGPAVIIICLFAKDILQIWLGREFAVESTAVMQILAVGVLFNSLAHIPFALIQGVGRPDLPAKFHILELPIYVVIAWLLVSRWGIVGAATAWTLRVAIDSFLLFWAAFKIHRFSLELMMTNGTAAAGIAFVTLGIVAYGIKELSGSLPLIVQCLLSVMTLIVFGRFSWRFIMDVRDRQVITDMIKLRNRRVIQHEQ